MTTATATAPAHTSKRGLPPSRGTYCQGCRCPDCTEENRVYIERYRRGDGVEVGTAHFRAIMAKRRKYA